MPITIKELHIKINVDEKSNDKPNNRGSKGGNQDEIITACVEEVMDILKRQNDR
ncbi:DUF5908 family protein [Tenacibaculum sp. SZ-18]|uniref:DUF5908 family protein n=1 Tax=Tenacibaculum sp. SZ-18 TaxID=754423 RepID=UPI0018E261B4|nr:DUF5908 family protein [Tenacibaculum sp. SZ-18]